jgi:hypothetical protein
MQEASIKHIGEIRDVNLENRARSITKLGLRTTYGHFPIDKTKLQYS